MKLVVGLGNPGTEYSHTRHNVGFMVLDQLVQEWKEVSKLKSAISKHGDVLYLKPLTFMNNSGEAVRAVLDYYHIAFEDLLVVFDDKDLPLGTVRFRSKGSSGGHNGIKSIIQHLGSEEFARLKVGIAPTDPDRAMGDTAEYVLGTFSKAEQKVLPEIIDHVILKVKDWIQ